MLYDTHCHPYLQKDKSKTDILKTFNEQNPEGFLNSIWTNLKTSLEAIKEAKENDFIRASIWIHPCDIRWLDLQKSINTLEKLYLENKDYIVAIWECGLDYYRLKAENDEKIKKYAENKQEKIIKLNKKLQKIFFIAQIKLAQKYSLPVVIHNRESKYNIFEIIKETGLKNFVFHCYSEDLEYAQKLLEFSPNCKISFSGIVTFNNAKEVRETAINIPLKNILVETDAPYLTPAPHRGKQENEPTFTKHTLEKIIELRSETPEVIKKQIFKNSIETFIK